MTHAGQTSRYFLLFSYQNVATVPEDYIHMRSVEIPYVVEQMESNVRYHMLPILFFKDYFSVSFKLFLCVGGRGERGRENVHLEVCNFW